MVDHFYEDAILSAQESEVDECHDCEYKGNACRSQCMESKPVYNLNLK